MVKIVYLLAIILGLSSCMPGKHPTPLPEQLMEATVALVADNGDKEWHLYCGGVWVAKDLIVTAYHCAVVGKIESLTPSEVIDMKLSGELPKALHAPVFFSDREGFDVLSAGCTKHYKSIVVAVDPEHDLALIHTFDAYPPHRMATFEFRKPTLGSEALIAGHPAGLAFTYTHGYVSGYHSDINHDEFDIRGPFLQINANIVGGNSGGGVFDKDGKLLGILAFIQERAIGQGFAIPSDRVNDLVEKHNRAQK